MTAAATEIGGGGRAPRLAIIVPYRDRAAHLARFLPHMVHYFTAGPAAAIACAIHVVEQSGTETFNKARLVNAGFLLAREAADYVCLHDVDYLPIRADYSFTPRPTLLISEGFREARERRGVDAGYFFGAVVALATAHFEQANGFNNNYWGWGFQDADFGVRCRAEGLTPDHREGVFEALDHASRQHDGAGRLLPEARANARAFQARVRAIREDGAHRRIGLSTLRFALRASRRLDVDPSGRVPVHHHLVDIGRPPKPP
ncbi:MAG: galactosyltransferase-related protein [Alphaproteobacteria bacterium]